MNTLLFRAARIPGVSPYGIATVIYRHDPSKQELPSKLELCLQQASMMAFRKAKDVLLADPEPIKPNGTALAGAGLYRGSGQFSNLLSDGRH